MAKADSTTTVDQPSAPSFEAFDWLPKNLRNRERDLLARARDVSSGVELTLQLIERSSLDSELDDAYLNPRERGVLERFSITACQMLSDAVDKHFESLTANEKGGAQ